MSEVSRHSAIPKTGLLPVHDFVDAEQQVVGRCKDRVDSVDRGGQALRVPQTVERSNCGGLMSWPLEFNVGHDLGSADAR
jgi:hypothetical protein